ncbi:CREB-binding protein [Myotis brandtii]|uniref:CREB-binding protein n=1 Tax=Myotis brandtii TaxID=109478 RepID=S7N379_MYOBR|nr:CREB-binding protein [Myotis brandtii]
MGGLNPQGQALNIMNPGRNPSVARMNHSTERCHGATATAAAAAEQQEGSAVMAAGLAGHAQFQQPQGR